VTGVRLPKAARCLRLKSLTLLENCGKAICNISLCADVGCTILACGFFLMEDTSLYFVIFNIFLILSSSIRIVVLTLVLQLFSNCLYFYILLIHVSSIFWDNSVGIGTCYGLGIPRIESRWGRDFSYTSRPTLGTTQPPVQWVPGLSRG
jgi:hypothetical protein